MSNQQTLIQRLQRILLLKRFGNEQPIVYWQKINQLYLLLLLPCLLIGIWNVGFQIANIMSLSASSELSGWQNQMFSNKDWSNISVLTQFILGFSYFCPLLLVCYITYLSWNKIFAFYRHRKSESGGVLICLLFIFLLPPTFPIVYAVVGISFGVVFGQLIFAGNGRYLVNPALLGLLFLYFSYPSLFNGQTGLLPIANQSIQSSWQALFTTTQSLDIVLNWEWSQFFLGKQIGYFQPSSIFFSLIALWGLIQYSKVSWLLPTGVIMGSILATVLSTFSDSLLINQFAWYHHFLFGSLLFCLAFIATDHSVLPLTLTGQFIFGGLFSFLTILIRTYNPSHPEGSLLALMLVSLLVPLIDWIAIELQRKINRFFRQSKKSSSNNDEQNLRSLT